MKEIKEIIAVRGKLLLLPFKSLSISVPTNSS